MVRISDAEFEVMKVIWKRKEATSTEIIGDLKDCNWSPNTIRTLIKRLEKKGAIEVVRKTGKTYTYGSLVDEKQYKNEITRDLLKRLYNNSLAEFVIQYNNGAKMKEEDMSEIIENIEKILKNHD